ncbi:MAG: M23 family metallopeptidase [Microbacteriaceae bacterium]
MRTAARLLYRRRYPMMLLACALLLGLAFAPTSLVARPARTVIALAGIAALALALALTALRRFIAAPAGEALSVTPPVTGRWLVLNGPSSAVPSHGVRLWGQAYAVDLVADPLPSLPTHDPAATRPEFGSPAFREAQAYPAFGQPVYAMVSGEVVAVHRARRDHRARSSHLSLLWLMAEGFVRQLGGTRWLLGNYVTIRAETTGGRSVYATVAHLQRGSVLVRAGDRVTAGQRIASCGNTGNSSEPHVHAQLQDHPRAMLADGLPMTFAPLAALPVNGEHLEVGAR